MIERMTDREALAMQRLMNNSDFRTVLEWTQRSLAEVQVELELAHIDQVPRLQGQASVLRSFISATVDFPAELRRLAIEENRKNTGPEGS